MIAFDHSALWRKCRAAIRGSRPASPPRPGVSEVEGVAENEERFHAMPLDEKSSRRAISSLWCPGGIHRWAWREGRVVFQNARRRRRRLLPQQGALSECGDFFSSKLERGIASAGHALFLLPPSPWRFPCPATRAASSSELDSSRKISTTSG